MDIKTQFSETVQTMLESDFYPDKPANVELLQTQMSFIFLAGKYAYKIKKPVNLGYLDYTTLEKRRYFCERELELNQRLCPDTYLSVLPITRNKGKICLDENGDIIDYAVKMRVLPRDKMLNILLEKDQVTDKMMERLANFITALKQMILSTLSERYHHLQQIPRKTLTRLKNQ